MFNVAGARRFETADFIALPVGKLGRLGQSRRSRGAVFFAKALKFQRREYFETDEAARQVPKVEF